MLPMNLEAGRKNAFKYADTGIRETLRQMTAKGALKTRGPLHIHREGGDSQAHGNVGKAGEREGLQLRADDGNYL